MGLFENLGRKVEEFKQEATEASREQADYRCGDCDAIVYGGRDDCPDCGSTDLVAREPDAPAAADSEPFEATTGDSEEVDPADDGTELSGTDDPDAET